MKALLLTAPSQLELVDFPTPRPAEGEVLLRVRACGICGSDIHGWDGSSGRRQPPLIMGHEGAGEIEAVGPKVSKWKPGDRVTFDSTLYCGECFYCRRGQFALCEKRRVVGVSPGEYRQHGAFAEYLAVPERVLYRLPEGLKFEQAAMVEPVAIAVHAVRRARVSSDDTVAVVGSGMIGLFITQALRWAGAKRIIAIDLEEKRLALARELGATDTMKSEGDIAGRIAAMTGGRGADIAFEVVGLSATVNLALNLTRRGGTVVLVGNLSPKVEFPLQIAVTRELSVLGSTGCSEGEYPICIDLISRGVVRVEPMVSAIAPLDEGRAWFERLSEKGAGSKYMKVILQP